jgi:hypothetical protein
MRVSSVANSWSATSTSEPVRRAGVLAIHRLAPAADLDGRQLALEVDNLTVHQPAVGLELGLTRAPRADRALGPLKVGPHPPQSGLHVLELRQLNLQRRLPRLRAGGEDVEDQLSAVDDAQAEVLLQVHALTWAQRMVDDDHLGAEFLGQRADLLDFPFAEGGAGLDPRQALHDAADHVRAGGLGQGLDFVQRIGNLLGGAPREHQSGDEGAVRLRGGGMRGAASHQSVEPPASVPMACCG